MAKIKHLKVLNLYPGIGGNRKLWNNVSVTAVEIDEEIAGIYQDNFPDDKVVIGDAHSYLLENFNKFPFIWSSPPCQTNSRVFEAGIKSGAYSEKVKLEYHDLSVYQQVLLLQRYHKGKFSIENVEPFYKPLIPAKRIDRHLFWTNFNIGGFTPRNQKLNHQNSEADYLETFFGFRVPIKDKLRKRQILRNCVHPETGKYILDCARGVLTRPIENQEELWQDLT